MRHFPIFMDLQGRRAVVLGTGAVARRKADALARAGAMVEIVGQFRAGLLDGCALAVGADAPEADLQELTDAARRAGVPVNVVDRPELCSFIMPAIVDRDPLTIAIGSAGNAPVLARLLRARIEAVVPPAYGRLAALAGEFKAALRRNIPDVTQRRQLLERLLTGPAADLVFAGQDDAARGVFADSIAAGVIAGDGVVFLVGAGPGAADLLTLRAQRLLGEADVIVHDRQVTSAVLDMARRDADRIDLGETGVGHDMAQSDITALLARLAREGRRVVRLSSGDPLIGGHGGAEAEALRAAGIGVEIVPGITTAQAFGTAMPPPRHTCLRA